MHLPIYQHPSLTVLIDDSATFLRSLAFQLPASMTNLVFDDTDAALTWLRAASPVASMRQGGLRASFDTYGRPPEQCNVAIDIEQICRTSLSPQRFMTPSVLVIDYSMPQMNGVEFCQAVRHLPCKKILFTGAADEKVAVDAFNRGLIDRYIKKSDDDALDTLEAEILTLQDAFFADQSDTLHTLLAVHHSTFVSDPALAALVNQLRDRHGFVEHYLFPSPAGILFYDSEARPSLLIIETDASMDSHYEVARDNDAPPELLGALQERCIVPFFHDGDGMYAGAFRRDWHRYCEAARICQGRQNYYWALFALPPSYMLGPVLPFAQFLRERQNV